MSSYQSKFQADGSIPSKFGSSATKLVFIKVDTSGLNLFSPQQYFQMQSSDGISSWRLHEPTKHARKDLPATDKPFKSWSKRLPREQKKIDGTIQKGRRLYMYHKKWNAWSIRRENSDEKKAKENSKRLTRIEWSKSEDPRHQIFYSSKAIVETNAWPAIFSRFRDEETTGMSTYRWNEGPIAAQTQWTSSVCSAITCFSLLCVAFWEQEQHLDL